MSHRAIAHIVLNVASALSAIVAAVFWFLSARVEVPSSFSVHVSKPDGLMGEPLGGNPLGGQHIGHAHSRDFETLAEGLQKQNRLSAWAAVSAGVAALLQAGSLLTAPE